MLSPVIDRWVPVLEQGLIGGVHPAGAVSERGEEERLHWSGLHVALQVRSVVDACTCCHSTIWKLFPAPVPSVTEVLLLSAKIRCRGPFVHV